MTKKVTFLMAALLVMGLLAACGGGSATEAPVGDAAAGEALFSQSVIDNQPGCSTCHSLEPDVVIVGPSLAGVAARAGKRVSGMSAEDYIRTSILDPNAYVVDGFQPNVMVQVWAELLTPEQVDNLVAFLLTQK